MRKDASSSYPWGTATDKSEHLEALSKHDIAPVDMIVANLCPFAQTAAAGADYETCIENVDIGDRL